MKFEDKWKKPIIRKKNCLICKKEFECVGGKQKNKKTCSPECKYALLKLKIKDKLPEMKRKFAQAEENQYKFIKSNTKIVMTKIHKKGQLI